MGAFAWSLSSSLLDLTLGRMVLVLLLYLVHYLSCTVQRHVDAGAFVSFRSTISRRHRLGSFSSQRHVADSFFCCRIHCFCVFCCGRNKTLEVLLVYSHRLRSEVSPYLCLYIHRSKRSNSEVFLWNPPRPTHYRKVARAYLPSSTLLPHKCYDRLSKVCTK